MNLSYAIVGHLFGDYIIQNDFLALNKKKSTPICLLHCLLWTFSVMAFAGWWHWWVFGVLLVTHFIQDRTGIVRWWMHIIGQDKFAGPPLGPWSIIAVDNVLHILVLYGVARFV